MAAHTAILECPDHQFDHLVLLRAVGRDEFLFHLVALDRGGVAAAGELQPVVRAKLEWLGYSYKALARKGGLNEPLLRSISGDSMRV